VNRKHGIQRNIMKPIKNDTQKDHEGGKMIEGA